MNSSLQRRRERRRASNTTAVLVLVFAVVGVFGAAHLFKPVVFSGFIHVLARPLWNFEAVIVERAAQNLSLLRSKRDLVLENRRLSRRATLLEGEHALLSLFREENARLKVMFGRSEHNDRTLAAILARPPVSLYDTLVIDIGSAHGVSVGDSVFVYGETIIGSVEKVFQRTSLVTLFSSPGKKTDVLIGSSRIEANAEGRGGGNFEARLPRDIPLSSGDTVTIPGLDPTLFAIVETIIENPTDPFQIILFKTPVNLYEVEWVEVEHMHTS